MDKPAPFSPSSRSRFPIELAPIWFLIVALVAGLAFEPAWRNQLWMDDLGVVKRLQAPTSLSATLRDALQPWFPADDVQNDWRPVARLTIVVQSAILSRLGSGAVWPYYVFNMAAHAAVCVLLLLAALRWGIDRRAALLGALIFASHPIHAEAVHQIVGRAELLAAGFMLSGLILWTRWGPWSAHALWQQPLIFALALGSKEHAVLYPFYLIVAALAGRPGSPNPAFKNRPPANATGSMTESRFRRNQPALVFALLGIVLASFLAAKGIQTGGLKLTPEIVLLRENILAHLPASGRIAGAFGALGYAATHLVWPAALVPDYSAFTLSYTRGWHWPMAWLGLSLVLLLSGYAVVGARRGAGGWGLAVGGSAGWLLTSNLFFVIGASPEARLWYWPSAAACLGIGWIAIEAIDRIPAARLRRPLFPATAGVATLLLLYVSWKNAIQWRDAASAAEAVLAVYPDNWRAHANLSAVALKRGDYWTGMVEAQYAVLLIPSDGKGHYWLGLNQFFMGDRDALAEAALKRSIELGPALPEAFHCLAKIYRRQGRPDEARAILSLGVQNEIVAKEEAAKILSGMTGGPPTSAPSTPSPLGIN